MRLSGRLGGGAAWVGRSLVVGWDVVDWVDDVVVVVVVVRWLAAAEVVGAAAVVARHAAGPGARARG